MANPNAQYRWTSSSGEIVSNTRYLEFPNIHRNDNETYTCVASNSAGLEKNSSLKIDVQCEYYFLLTFHYKFIGNTAHKVPTELGKPRK